MDLTTHKFLIRGGKTWHLTQEFYDELKETYPLHDVEGEIRKAKLWVKNAPRRRKTAKGMKRYISGWIARSEETGHVTEAEPKLSFAEQRELDAQKDFEKSVEQYAVIIHDWTIDKLKNSYFFKSAMKNPLFRAWAIEQRPDLIKKKKTNISSFSGL